MIPRPACRLAALILAAIVSHPGCAQRGLSGERHAVQGTLTLDGKVVPYAVVEFSQDADRGQVQSAIVRAGRFSLETAAGLPAGIYSVAVMPYVPEIEETATLAPAERAGIAASQSLVPEIYQKRGLLKATVEPEGANEIVLAMESKPR